LLSGRKDPSELLTLNKSVNSDLHFIFLKFNMTLSIPSLLSQEDLPPLANGEEAADNLTKTLAIDPNHQGITYDLGVETVLLSFDQITSAHKNGEWITFREWLQREEQKNKWTSKGRRAAKSYLQGVFQTAGVTEEFLICDIDFLIRDIKRQKDSQPKLKKLWDKMLKWLEKNKELGAKYVILDGQNRIKHALIPYRYESLGIPLNCNGQKFGDLRYSALDDITKSQIDNRRFRVSIIKAGDVTKVVDKLININDGEPWGDHERRDVLWTSVSFDIKNIASYPKTSGLHNNILKDIWTGNYSTAKKGVTLFIAEMLHFIRNGYLGSASTLTEMYKAEDENIEKQLVYLDKLFKLVSQNFPKKVVSKSFTKETYRNLLIYLGLLTGEKYFSHSKNLTHTFTFTQIKNPNLLITRIVDAHKAKYADRSQIIPFKRGSNTSLTHEQAKAMEENGEGGKIVWSNANASPGTYIKHHTGSKRTDLDARQYLFTPDLNKIIEECLADGTLVTTDARSITSNDRMVAEMKYLESNSGYEPESLKTVIDKELDHDLSVKLGGDSFIDNLNFIPKEDNRRKGAN